MRIPLRFKQPVSLQIPAEGGTWHATTLLNYTDDLELVVTRPATLAEGAALEAGVPVGLELPLPDGLRRYTVKVRGTGESPPTLRLTWPEGGERIQRREAVRVPVELPAVVSMLGEDGTPGPKLNGKTSDLSVGGMRINLPEPLPAGSTLQIEAQVRGVGWLECAGRVVRGGELAEPRGPERYWIAVIFTQVAQPVMREINKVVFDVQREMLRRPAL